MTKQGRKIVDRIGRAKGGKIAGRYNDRIADFESAADGFHEASKGEGDLWNNFARGAYMDKSLGHTARRFKNPEFKKPVNTGSNKGTATQTTPLQQATAGANPGSVAERVKRDVIPSPKQSLIGKASENISSLFRPKQNGTAMDLPSETAKRLREQDLFLTEKEAAKKQAATNEKRRATRAAKKRQKEEEEKSRITMKQGNMTQTVKPLGVKRQNQAQRQASTQQLAERINPVTTGGIGTATLANAGSSKVTRAAEVQTLHSTRNYQRNRQRR